MTPETTIGLAMTAMIAVIGYFLKTLIDETRSTSKTTHAMYETLKGATEAIIALQQTDKEHARQIINIVERLVRIEERTQSIANPPQQTKRIRAGK